MCGASDVPDVECHSYFRLSRSISGLGQGLLCNSSGTLVVRGKTFKFSESSKAPSYSGKLPITLRRDAYGLDVNGEREFDPIRWGFTKDDIAPQRPKHMHARSETIDTLPNVWWTSPVGGTGFNGCCALLPF